MPAKYAAQAEGISERVFYKWKAEGEALLERIADKDGEIIQAEYDKLNETQKLEVQFIQSVGRSEEEREAILVARIMAATEEDRKAAMQILQRRFLERWANKDYPHIDQEVNGQPDKLKEVKNHIEGLSQRTWYRGPEANVARFKDICGLYVRI